MATYTEQTAHQEDRTLVYHQCSRLDGLFTRKELRERGHVPQHDTNALHYSGGWFEGIATENTPEYVVFPTLHANAQRAVQSAEFLFMTPPPANRARLIYDWVREQHGEAYHEMLAAQEHEKGQRSYTLQPLKPWDEGTLIFRDFTPDFVERKVIETVAANFRKGLITNNPGDRWYVRPLAYRDMPLDKDGHPVPHMGVASLDCDVIFEMSVRNVSQYTSDTPAFVLFRLPPLLRPKKARAFQARMGDSLYELCQGHDNLNGSRKVSANYTLLARMKNMAKLNGFEDGLYVDPSPDQNLGEGGGMNVYLLLLDEEGSPFLKTPSTELQHILPGTKRALFLEQARRLGVRVIDDQNVPSHDIRHARSMLTSGSWARVNPVGYLADFPTGEYTRLDGFVSEEALYLARQNKALLQLGEVDSRIKHLQGEPHLTVVSLDELVKIA
ncbi:aminotransferase class IV [Candidatus Woesearchaeota archaeon]|nr:aminotransferase class IV [Candidatus Woesearchaeota archaeon]